MKEVYGVVMTSPTNPREITAFYQAGIIEVKGLQGVNFKPSVESSDTVFEDKKDAMKIMRELHRAGLPGFRVIAIPSN